MSTVKHFDLVQGARQAMLDAHFQPEIPPAAQAEAARLHPARTTGPGIRDLRTLAWSSIDNDESRDLDQIEMAEALANGHVRVRVGIADVDALVHRGSALDAHAAHNTCTIYTGARVFPMLPESLSTDHTSLGEGVERLALVVEMDVDSDGKVVEASVYRAAVKNHAKLAYDGVGAWLEGSGPAPSKVGATEGIEAQLRLQDSVARCLKKLRYERGALDLETIEARAVVDKEGAVTRIELTKKSRARALIEDFMIAANGAMARFLDERHLSSIRRVVKAPERWARIVALAAHTGDVLPP
ncbi:MAG TPA: ribonuclease catalytic domain-containing protein, partial [Polyangiaceae bacterium]|nr:ribonuclease catalytic domain-containing protein [Polyangiaceae bacterium]